MGKALMLGLVLAAGIVCAAPIDSHRSSNIGGWSIRLDNYRAWHKVNPRPLKLPSPFASLCAIAASFLVAFFYARSESGSRKKIIQIMFGERVSKRTRDALIEVDAPGLSSSNLDRFAFRHVRRPIFPLDQI